MRKLMLICLVALFCGSSFSGEVGLPTEHLAIPVVEGSHLVCIWDESAGNWYAGFSGYDHSGKISFQVPALGQWYWIGVWDQDNGEYVYGKWIGHFLTD
jgi:hypothetical protein